jgi:hypothetical protein
MTTTTTIDPAILETLPESFPAEEVCISLFYPDEHDLKDPEAYVRGLFEHVKILVALELEIDDMERMMGDDEYIGWEYDARNDEEVKMIYERFPDHIYRTEQERFQESVEEDRGGDFEEAGLDIYDLPENLFDYYDLQADEGGEQVYVRKSL